MKTLFWGLLFLASLVGVCITLIMYESPYLAFFLALLVLGSLKYSENDKND